MTATPSSLKIGQLDTELLGRLEDDLFGVKIYSRVGLLATNIVSVGSSLRMKEREQDPNL